MPAYVELYMDQGATFNNIINFSDDVTGANINISGYSVTSQMRRSYYSQNATANIVCNITDASNGELAMHVTASNTANIPPGNYLFDVKAVDMANSVFRVLEGIITVTPSVTKT